MPFWGGQFSEKERTTVTGVLLERSTNTFDDDIELFQRAVPFDDDLHLFPGILKEILIRLYVVTEVVTYGHDDIVLFKTCLFRRTVFHHVPNPDLTVYPIDTQTGIGVVELIAVMGVGQQIDHMMLIIED